MPAIAAVLLALSVGQSNVAEAQTVLEGRAGQAFYRIVVPDPWNGDLVIWNHGFSLAPVGPVSDSDLGPLAPLQLAQGYAVAASSYRLTGWAVFKTNDDLGALYEVFVENVGPPQKVFVTGGSLGGLVTAAAIEGAQRGNVAGAMNLCGAVAGSRNWDAALDTRLVYDALCAEVPGASIPGGAAGLPSGSTLTSAGVALAAHACFGVLAPPAFRTPDQQARLATFSSVTQIPETFVLPALNFVTFTMSDLVHDPGKLKGRIGTGNTNVTYGEPAIDALIERVAPHPGGASRLQENYTPSGNVGDVRIVSLHTDKDGFVVVENQSEYASVVPSSNLTTAIVVEEIPSHCGFSNAEAVAAWEALRSWVAGAPQPSAATIQGLCTLLAPAVGGPCRIDPAFVVPDLDTRIRPR